MKIRFALLACAFAGILGNGQSLAQNAYITNGGSNNVSVIDTTANTVIATIPVGSIPSGVAVSPDGDKVYVVDQSADSVSVITTATNTVSATIPVGSQPVGVAVSPDGSEVYVTNAGFNVTDPTANSVSVIATATNTVTATIPVGTTPEGVAVSPDGSKVYVTNSSGSVSVIEVDDGDAPAAREILEAVMTEAFALTFPGAPTKGVAEAATGTNWMEAKA